MKHKDWFRILGYPENPLSIKPTEHLIGQEEALSEILEGISSGNMIYLEGSLGSGKTSILKHVIKYHMGRKKVVHVYCNIIKDYESIVLMKKGLGRIFKIRRKGLIVLLDEADHITEKGLEIIKAYFDENVIKSVLFSGTNPIIVTKNASIDKRIGNRFIRLKELSDAQAVQLIKTRLDHVLKLPDKILMNIYDISRNPRQLLQNCETVCKHAILGKEITFDVKLEKERKAVVEVVKDKLGKGSVEKFLQYLSSD